MQSTERKSVLLINFRLGRGSGSFCPRKIDGESHFCDERCGKRRRRGGSRRSRKKWGLRILPGVFPKEFPNIPPGGLREPTLKGSHRLQVNLKVGQPFRAAA